MWVLDLVRDFFPILASPGVWGTIGIAETQLKFSVRGGEY